MELELSHPQKIQSFITLFQHLDGFSANVNFLFYSDRIYMQTMDAAHVSVCELFLPSSWFEKYVVPNHLSNGKYIQIGINVSIMARVLKIINNRNLGGGCGSTAVLSFRYEKNSDVLGVFLFFTRDIVEKKASSSENEDQDKVDTEKENKSQTKKQEYHFELPLVFLTEDRMKIPTEMDYSADFAFSSESFSEMVKNLRVFGNTIRFECSEDWIALSSNSEDQGMMKIPLKTEDLDFFAIEENCVLDIAFRSSFMSVISQFHKLSNWVMIRLTQGFPLQITYNLEVGMRNMSENDIEENVYKPRLVFYLAESNMD